MPTIYLPTFAAFEGDAKTSWAILEKEVLKKHSGIGAGLEIYGKPEHFAEEALATLAKNVRDAAGDVKTIVHGIISYDAYLDGSLDIGEACGKEVLQRYIRLARTLKSEYVHTHSWAPHQGVEHPKDRAKKVKRIRENLLECLKRTEGIPLGIENQPSPSCGDLETNPKKVYGDYVELVNEVMEVVSGTSLKVTFDTCHYGVNQKPGASLIIPIKKIGSYLGHIHIGDCGKETWVPFKSRYTEGLVPGEGRVGEKAFRNFFEFIIKTNPNVSLGMEVRDTDYKDRKETIRALEKVCGWIEEFSE